MKLGREQHGPYVGGASILVRAPSSSLALPFAHLCPSLIPIRIVAVGSLVFHLPTFVMYLFFY